MKQLLDYITENVTGQYITFRITAHMIKNSEMNATLKIREFFKKTNYIEFDNLAKGGSIRNPINLISNGQISETTISLKKPPSKDESRMWIFNLGEHVQPSDMVLMLFVNDKLTAIPLNQDLSIVIRVLKRKIRTTKFEFERLNTLEKEKVFRASKIDFIEKAKNDKLLGLEGELFVVAFEQLQLESIGRVDLSDKVEHKSISEGDGLGYDILSFDKEGTPKHIEVKTTNGNVYNQFYMSKNEIEFLKINSGTYYIYRVHDFDKKKKTGKIKVIHNDIISQIELKPVSFKCNLKK